MNDRIRKYVDQLFEDAPQKHRILEMKEELLSNMNEKYEDLLAQGSSEDEAFTIVAAGIGDVDSLIQDLDSVDRSAFMDAERQRKHSALLKAIAIGLYIIGAGMFMVFQYFLAEEIAMMITLIFFAAATAMLVYTGQMTKKKYTRGDDSFVEEYKEKISVPDKEVRLRGAASSTLWTVVAILYFLLSFSTGRWNITWIVFLIGAVLQQVLLSLFGKKLHLGGIIWTSAVVLYLTLSFLFGNWATSWIIFLVAAAVQQIIRLLTIWRQE